ncbi:MAG: NAD(P)-dependent oxidoreductase [Candidatus Eremiobacteraeota bacterium]|nr:NAD(P)-dependent oxidoreductase [Candidatus Eremiobacteraeota bacterium]
MSNAKLKIGFIGLGTMGLGMAQCLLAAGHEVVGYNRTRSRGEPLAAKGGKLAATPQEAVAGADVVWTMLSDDPAVEEVLLGERGVMRAGKKGALFIDSSTVTPAMSRRCAQEAKAHGLRFLDAPVTGSRNEAAGGKLVFMVGGDKHDYDEVTPLLDVTGQARYYCGPSGAGATLKLCNNAISASLTNAMAESFTVVKASGIDQKVALDFLSENGAFASRLSKTKLPKMAGGDYSANFQLKLMAKDLRYFIALANEFHRNTPAIELVGQQLADATQAGHGDEDIAAIYAYLLEKDAEKVGT